MRQAAPSAAPASRASGGQSRPVLEVPARRGGSPEQWRDWSLLATLLQTAHIRGIGASFCFEYEMRPPILRGDFSRGPRPPGHSAAACSAAGSAFRSR
jgi:hypothetical protein